MYMHTYMYVYILLINCFLFISMARNFIRTYKHTFVQLAVRFRILYIFFFSLLLHMIRHYHFQCIDKNCNCELLLLNLQIINNYF